MRAWTPNSKYGAHAFGISWDAKKKISSFDMFYAERERILPWIKQYSPYELVSRDDPPVGLFYSAAPNLGKDEKDPTHTANFGVKLKEHCDANGKSAANSSTPALRTWPTPPIAITSRRTCAPN